MTVQLPLYLEKKLYPAKLDRGLIAEAFQPGVFGPNDYKVSSAGGMSTSAASGWACVAGTTNLNQGSYLDFNDAAVVRAHAGADGANPRIDQVVLHIYDSTEVGTGSDLGDIEIIEGTPAAGATLDNRSGATALPATCLRLADVLIPAGSSSVSSGNIRDRRQWARGLSINFDTTNVSSLTNNNWTTVTNTAGSQRAELSGADLFITAVVVAYASTGSGANGTIAWRARLIGLEGTTLSDEMGAMVSGLLMKRAFTPRFISPSAGSHTIDSQIYYDGSGTATGVGGGTISIREDLRPHVNNN